MRYRSIARRSDEQAMIVGPATPSYEWVGGFPAITLSVRGRLYENDYSNFSRNKVNGRGRELTIPKAIFWFFDRTRQVQVMLSEVMRVSRDGALRCGMLSALNPHATLPNLLHALAVCMPTAGHELTGCT